MLPQTTPDIGVATTAVALPMAGDGDLFPLCPGLPATAGGCVESGHGRRGIPHPGAIRFGRAVPARGAAIIIPCTHTAGLVRPARTSSSSLRPRPASTERRHRRCLSHSYAPSPQ